MPPSTAFSNSLSDEKTLRRRYPYVIVDHSKVTGVSHLSPRRIVLLPLCFPVAWWLAHRQVTEVLVDTVHVRLVVKLAVNLCEWCLLKSQGSGSPPALLSGFEAGNLKL